MSCHVNLVRLRVSVSAGYCPLILVLLLRDSLPGAEEIICRDGGEIGVEVVVGGDAIELRASGSSDHVDFLCSIRSLSRVWLGLDQKRSESGRLLVIGVSWSSRHHLPFPS